MTQPDPANTPGKDEIETESTTDDTASGPVERPKEIGGRRGPDPTRYGDWEKAGRCIDF